MTDPSNSEATSTARAAASPVLKPMMEASQEISAKVVGLNQKLRDLIIEATRDNASSFADAMTEIASAKNPLDGARIYSDFLMSFVARASKQFMDVTQAISRSKPGQSQ